MTKVSIKTKPKTTRKRIWGPDPGFLEMPSQALLIALAWQNAPTATARVMMPAPRMRDNLKKEAFVESAGATWAKRGLLRRNRNKSRSPKDLRFFVISFLLLKLMFFLMGHSSC